MISTYIFPPRSFICSVTTASPIQTMVKTPEKTSDDWSSCARMDRNMLRSKQKMRGPLPMVVRTSKLRISQASKKEGNIPQIPISEPLTHASLKDSISVRPAAQQSPKATSKPAGFPSLGGADTTAALQKATEQILGPQDLSHLLPYCQQVSRERLPHALVDCILRRATILSRDRRCQIIRRKSTS